MYRFDYCDGFAVISVTVSLELYWNTLGLNDTVTKSQRYISRRNVFRRECIVVISVTVSLKLS